jgi:hypothetical protein
VYPLTAVRSVSVDFAAVLIITLMTITAPAFLHDDALFFNYANNVRDPHVLYYHGGYVHAISETVSYALSPAPFVVQAVAYRVVPFALALLLYREIARLLAWRLAGDEARLLALGIVLVLRAIEHNMWANLDYAAWMALLVAIPFVIRTRLEGASYSWFAFTGVLIAASTFPPGIVLALLFLGCGATTSSRRARVQNFALALIAAAVQAWVVTGSPEPALNRGLLTTLRAFVDTFRDNKLHNVIACASLLASLTLLAFWVRGDSRARRDDVAVSAAACAVAVGWTVLYVMSSRFAEYGAFESRYAVLPAFCAMLVIAWTVLADRAPLRRSQSVGVFTGIAITLITAGLYGTLRGPLEFALMKYQFLAAAAEAQANCPPDEAFVFEDAAGSPLVFCTRQSLPASGDYYLTGFVPSIGVAAPDDEPEDRPFLLNPKPFP